jgi:hypothetical protein
MGHIVKERAKLVQDVDMELLDVPCISSLANGMFNCSAHQFAPVRAMMDNDVNPLWPVLLWILKGRAVA